MKKKIFLNISYAYGNEINKVKKKKKKVVPELKLRIYNPKLLLNCAIVAACDWLSSSDCHVAGHAATSSRE